MKSMTLYSSFSLPLIRENFRRFWAIPALSFLLYFLSGVFPILITYDNINRTASYISMSLSNMQPFYMAAHLMMPVMAAVIIFRYLQTTSSVTMIHSLPFSRLRLYVSNLLSGLVLVLLPMLANGLILLIIAKPAYDQWAYQQGNMAELVNHFTRTAVLEWMWQSFLIILVVYAISIFAGLVTANSIMHMATALGFNFLVPSLYAVFVYYFDFYLFGYNSAGEWTRFALGISPFLEVFNQGRPEGPFPLGYQIYYLINALVLFVLSGYLYTRRRLERATESLAFQFMIPVICYLISFFGMTLLGVWFTELNGDGIFFTYAGYGAGALIFFLIGRMIVTKTPRIFNLATLKTFGLYCLIAVLFFTALQLDLTGFEKRIPAASRVDEVVMDNTLLTGGDRFTSGPYMESYAYQQYGNYRYGGSFRLKTPANIQAVIQLHREILDQRDAIENPKVNALSHTVGFHYNPDSMMGAERQYSVPYAMLKDSPSMKTIYESAEFKDMYSLKNLTYEQLRSVNLSNPAGIGSGAMIFNKKDIQELFRVMDQDFAAETFEEAINLKWPAVVVNIQYTVRNPETGRITDQGTTATISMGYTNTLAWLKEKGFSTDLLLNEETISRIELYHYKQPTAEESAMMEPGMPVYDTKYQEEPGMTIQDKDQIRQLLDIGRTTNINYDEYYYGTIFFQPPAGSPADAEYYTLPIYFEVDEVPSWIVMM